MGLSSIVEYEQITGKKITEIDEEMSLTDCANLLWIMLKQDQKDLTLDGACQLIDEYSDNVQDVMAKVAEAITAAFATGESKNVHRAVRKTSR
jgi:hypothetical protein